MKISKSTLSGEEYEIPSNLDDSVNIDNFIEANHGKKIIVVQGLGFVGAVMSIVCANSPKDEYAVIGIDLPSPDSYWKICSINNGIFPIISSDNKVEKYFKNSKEKENFYATYDPYAYSFADVIIVDINLDVQKDSSHIAKEDSIKFSVDLSNFKSSIKVIGNNCKQDALVLIETTVPPGTTELAYDILKECMINRKLHTGKINVGHSYERVMPGPNYIDSIKNFYRVYSGVNKKSADRVEKFLKTIISTKDYPLTRLKNTNSTELSKVLENSFRAMNIAFMVEWSRYAEESSVDLYEVVEAIRMRPTHKNIMLPGIGVGGYCLTKDPLLASWSKQNLFSSPSGLSMSENAVTTNDNMPYYAFQQFKSLFNDSKIENKKIFMLGVSYAPDVGDTRYTPVELMYHLLMKNSCELYLSDPFINFWEETQQTVSKNYNDIHKINPDAVMISTAHSEYKDNKNLIETILKSEPLIIYDTVGVLDDMEISSLSKKHIVKVLGRGDI